MRKMSLPQQNGRLALALAVAVAALAVGGGAWAGEPINLTGEASANGLVYIENLAGSIKVKGWDKNEVEVTGSLDEKAKKVNFETGGKKTVIEVVYPRTLKNLREGTHLVVMVPRGSRLTIESVSAEVEVSGVTGTIHTETVSGDVLLEKFGTEARVESVSGTVRASGGKAHIAAETVSGDIILDFDVFLDLSAESVSGAMKISGDFDAGGSFGLDGFSGKIVLLVPGGVSAEFEASSFNGDITTDFGHSSDRSRGYSPGSELQFKTGGGAADVTINTFSGDIEIRKQ